MLIKVPVDNNRLVVVHYRSARLLVVGIAAVRTSFSVLQLIVPPMAAGERVIDRPAANESAANEHDVDY